MLDRCYICLFE